MKLTFAPLFFTGIFVIGIAFLVIVARHFDDSSRQENLESSLTAKYSAEVKVTGEYTEQGKEIIVLMISGHRFVGIKGYGLVEVK